MNCCQARRELELMQRENNGALLRHLHRCSECRDYAEELRLVNLLRTMPAPEPSDYFEERMLNAALPKRRKAVHTSLRKWQLATAASLLVAVLAAVPNWRSPAPQPLESSVALPVSLSLDTPRALQGAVISVSLPDNLALEGYGDTRELQWQADLNAGTNRLTLPVRARTQSSAQILIRVEHNGAQRQFTIPVSLTAPAEALDKQPAVQPQTI